MNERRKLSVILSILSSLTKRFVTYQSVTCLRCTEVPKEPINHCVSLKSAIPAFITLIISNSQKIGKMQKDLSVET